MLSVADRLEQAKCPKSPTNAHHWMIPSTGAEPIGRCQFCGTERQFKGSWGADWIDFTEAHRHTVVVAIAKRNQEHRFGENW